MKATLPSKLRSIEQHIFQACGTAYEADVFSVLQRSPFVARSFEFSLADGAVDCSGKYDVSSSYGERFCSLTERTADDTQSMGGLEGELSELAPFDVKSTVGEQAGQQQYIMTMGQRDRMAFFIGINAADATFVDVIPNFHQRQESLYVDSSTDERREVAVSFSRVCHLPPATYQGIDPCMNPYRMPVALLPTAISRIRQLIRKEIEVYQNPWTRTRFPGWRPLTTRSSKFMFPNTDTAHYTACLAAMEIFRYTCAARDEGNALQADFVMSQPRLADLRLMCKGRQYFVQQKVDLALRRKGSPLARVGIARGEGEKRTYYFTAFERFDYLWYQFTFSRHPKPGEDIEVLFLPEKILPDEFYTTTGKEANFEREEFLPYRFMMDTGGSWLDRVRRIVAGSHPPRRPGQRPVRERPIPPPSSLGEPERVLATGSGSGRQRYRQALEESMRHFFHSMMSACASRGTGLLVVLAGNHPLGDLGYSRYVWSEEERDRYLHHGRIPRSGQRLPPETEIVPLCYYTQHAECSYQGPMLRARQWRRLEACSEGRLVLWDLSGPDGSALRMQPVLIPSDDISVTPAQRSVFELAIRQPNKRLTTPLVSALLHSGLFASDYVVGSQGGMAYAGYDAKAILALLDQFLSFDAFEHPPGYQREPARYRHTMSSVNQMLVDQHQLAPEHDDLFEEHDDDE
ncbi:hypothetical protein KC331_g235 [Hortaea werneckii]|nr:hypothetical protein KC331_g235 [Hortaea werneckii]KAI7722696.1 hypothetical protein KC353_g272 [Hortaea werneckii]